jgi:hypothetical protein
MNKRRLKEGSRIIVGEYFIGKEGFHGIYLCIKTDSALI